MYHVIHKMEHKYRPGRKNETSILFAYIWLFFYCPHQSFRFWLDFGWVGLEKFDISCIWLAGFGNFVFVYEFLVYNLIGTHWLTEHTFQMIYSLYSSMA